MDIALVIATFGLLVVTAFYAVANWRMIGEMRRAREQELRPVVTLFPRVDQDVHVFIVVRNMGRGPAKNVRFIFSQELRRADGVTLTQNARLFAEGIGFIAPQQEFCHWNGVKRSLSQRRDSGETLICSGRIEYDRVYFGEHYSEQFAFDLSAFTLVIDNPLARMGPPAPPTRFL